jgi:DNA repair exonuclease SbcCD nuclease subunit
MKILQKRIKPMSKTLIIGDIHLNERSIEEIDSIFEKDIFSIKAERLIQLGDFFDKNTPSPLEEKYASELILKIKKHYKEVIILSGNGEHDVVRNTSIIEHFASLGVKTVVGDYIEDVNLFCGHFMMYESNLAFGSGRMGIGDLAKYDKVFLGHQHSPQEIVKNNIYHVGSVRYVSFNEVNDKKHVVVLEDGKMSFIALKNSIPMLDVTDVSQLEQIDARTKVRVIFNSFDDYKKNASYVNKIGRKFFLFKVKMNFEESKIIVNASKKLDICPKNNLIQSYIDKIEDKDVRKLLEEQFNEKI